MNDIKKYFREIKNNKKIGRQIFVITFITALLFLFISINHDQSNSIYHYNDSNELKSIERKSRNVTEEYRLKVKIDTGDEINERVITIEKSASNNSKKKYKDTDKDAERDAELNSIISNIELANSNVIKLPAQLSDGSKLIWELDESKNTSIIPFLIAYLVLIALCVKSAADENLSIEKNIRKEIIKGLPRFTNQLLLMLNAGMILNDAFEMVGDAYCMLDNVELGYFEKAIVELVESNSDHRKGCSVIINEFAADHSVKELMRISTILTENEKRGSDIVDNLSRESKYLWDERKIVARESGKMIDTKMAYPLGLLLVILIVITMAPALLNI